ncbi:MAG: riboflavin biosynthesis protein RibF [Candidatus Margulisiibacteriota bacterium]
MTVPISLSGLPSTPVDALGIGVFDGVHLGHQEIMDLCDGILTFYPHPDAVLKKRDAIPRLTTRRELRFFIQTVITLKFTPAIAAMSPDQFLDDVIARHIAPRTIVVGYDFRFGHKKRGNIHTLIDWAGRHGVRVLEVPPFYRNAQPVKSDSIRQKFQDDRFNEAVLDLGHPYVVIGKVVQGEGRGRKLGFPTANLKVPAEKLLPRDGVYKGYVLRHGKKWPALISIGNQPTFGGRVPVCEVYIRGWTENLYGSYLTACIQRKVRDQQKFPSVSALKAQIEVDVTCL